MLAALVAGERNPKVLAQLARRTMRKKITVLEEAFTGYFTDHHAFLLGGCSPGWTRSPPISPPWTRGS